MRNKKRVFLLVLMLILLSGNQAFFSQTAEQPNDNENTKTKTTPPKGKNVEVKPLVSPTIKNKGAGSKTDTLGKDSSSPLKDTDSDKVNPGNVTEEPKENDKKDVEDDWLYLLLKWALFGLVGLLLIAGTITGIYILRRNKQRERDEINSKLNILKSQQKTFGGEIKQLSEVSRNLSQQIAHQKAEISSLKQAAQNNASYTPPPAPVSFQEEEPYREESQFPVSVEDYLAKVKRGATPVKYDYKEGMLVQDAEREGGLLIVRDDSTIDGHIYLIPSFGYFQTKSDYTNYYERYYACARPSGGNVWIRQPATVQQVNGGWQLANQGELEIR